MPALRSRVAPRSGVGHHAPVRLPLAIGVLFLWACGGQTRPKSPAPATGPKGGSLSAQLEKTLRAGPAHDDAIVTFAIFSTGAAPPAKDQREVVAKALRSARLGKRWAPGVVSAPTDGELPLDLKALAADVGPLGAAVSGATYVVFVRYVGRTGPAQRHLRAAAAAVSALLHRGVVVDLGVRRAYDAAGWRQWVDNPRWLADQVVPAIQRDADGNVAFFTRGMAKLGLPDLELTGVSTADARARFSGFQAFVAQIVARGHAKKGDTIESVTLKPCARPPEAIEHRCVAM